MRKKVFFSCALAALMLGSCTSSDDVTGGGTGTGENKTSYLSVNINSVGNAPSTRADYTKDDGTYEDGTGLESKINTVRFYFFNADGTPYILNNPGVTGKENYVDVQMESAGDDHDHTVETVTNAMLVLNGETDLAPASMLTVVNPSSCGDLLGTGSKRYSLLRRSTVGSKWNDDNGFVMTNSVYKDAGMDVCTTQLSGNLYNTSEQAKEHPTDVYVERVLAKVTATINKGYKRDSETENAWSQVTDGQYKDTWKIKVGTLKLATDEGSSKTVDVYAWVQGWGVADANSQAELTKQINIEWTDATLGIKPWNTADYHRCFWSNSCQVDESHPLLNTSFNNYKTNFNGTPIYTMPNTPDKAIVEPKTSFNNLTKVLVAAKLGYKDGETWKPAEICEYKGQEFLGQENIKKLILQENKRYFIKKTENGQVKYENMTDANVDFATSSTYNDKLRDYQVVAKVKDVDKLYRISDEDRVTPSNNATVNYTEVNVEDVNKEWAQNPVEIRTDGDAYYYTPIKHLGTPGTVGEYGVVRNHSYRVTIDDIQGWGTPVYDPDKTIIPTIPSNDKTYLAAQVKVLSWRVVSDNVKLDQTKKN